MKVYGNTEALEIIESCSKSNLPLLLMGETGVGKTTMVRSIATKKKKNLVRINLNGQTGREEILGKYVLDSGETKRQDGPMLQALRNGDRILLDEINAALPEVLFTLQALIETKDGKLGDINLVEKDGEIITPHKDCRIFATANPADKYIGAKDFNVATLSRFVVMDIHKLDPKEELKLLCEAYPKLDLDAITKSIAIGQKINGEYETDNVSYYCSTRDLLHVMELHQSGINLALAIRTGIMNKVQNIADKDIVQKICEHTLGTQLDSIKGMKADDIVKMIEDAVNLKKKTKQAEKELKVVRAEKAELEEKLKEYNKVEDTFSEAAKIFSDLSKNE